MPTAYTKLDTQMSITSDPPVTFATFGLFWKFQESSTIPESFRMVGQTVP